VDCSSIRGLLLSKFAPPESPQVDAEQALIVAQPVTTEANDQRSLLPMAEAAKAAVGDPPALNVVADAGYSNGEQAEGLCGDNAGKLDRLSHT